MVGWLLPLDVVLDDAFAVELLLLVELLLALERVVGFDNVWMDDSFGSFFFRLDLLVLLVGCLFGWTFSLLAMAAAAVEVEDDLLGAVAINSSFFFRRLWMGVI